VPTMAIIEPIIPLRKCWAFIVVVLLCVCFLASIVVHSPCDQFDADTGRVISASSRAAGASSQSHLVR